MVDAPVSDAAPADQANAVPASAIAIDYKAALLALLGLDDTADQAAIDAKSAELKAAWEKAGGVDALQAQLTEAQGKLAEIEKAKTMAEVDALLADYEMPPESAAAMRDLAMSNRDQATKLLGAMPKKAKPADAAAAAAPVDNKSGTPPPPMHDPKGAQKQEQTPQDKAAEAEKLIAAVRKEGKFPTYDAARNEARRRKPDLFV